MDNPNQSHHSLCYYQLCSDTQTFLSSLPWKAESFPSAGALEHFTPTQSKQNAGLSKTLFPPSQILFSMSCFRKKKKNSMNLLELFPFPQQCPSNHFSKSWNTLPQIPVRWTRLLHHSGHCCRPGSYCVWTALPQGAPMKHITTVRLTCASTLHSFTHLQYTQVQKYQIDNPKTNQLIRFKLHCKCHEEIISCLALSFLGHESSLCEVSPHSIRSWSLVT